MVTRKQSTEVVGKTGLLRSMGYKENRPRSRNGSYVRLLRKIIREEIRKLPDVTNNLK